MKKVFMTLAVVAAMFAATACSCNNNSKKAVETTEVECCGDTTKCAECPHKCDSTATCDTAAIAE